jgi:hypothetical protein
MVKSAIFSIHEHTCPFDLERVVQILLDSSSTQVPRSTRYAFLPPSLTSLASVSRFPSSLLLLRPRRHRNPLRSPAPPLSKGNPFSLAAFLLGSSSSPLLLLQICPNLSPSVEKRPYPRLVGFLFLCSHWCSLCRGQWFPTRDRSRLAVGTHHSVSKISKTIYDASVAGRYSLVALWQYCVYSSQNTEACS